MKPNLRLMLDEQMIHDMLEEISGEGSSESHYSIVERYFKKIREETKSECGESKLSPDQELYRGLVVCKHGRDIVDACEPCGRPSDGHGF